MHVLLVEDDDEIAGPLARGLEREGFGVTRVATGREAIALALARPPAPDAPAFVLIDVGLPDVSGFDVCRTIRASSSLPIIMVTARGEEIDRVVGLELGADDYIVKPFGVRELTARMRAVLRRTQAVVPEVAAVGVPPSGEQRIGSLVIDHRTHRVTVGSRLVELTPKEYDLLCFLASDPGAVRTRTEILGTVWDPHWYGPTKTLDVHVASVRKKLGDPAWIETVRGVGFRLRAEG